MHEYLGTRDVLSAYERKRNRDREREVIPLRKGMCVFVLIGTTRYSHTLKNEPMITRCEAPLFIANGLEHFFR